MRFDRPAGSGVVAVVVRDLEHRLLLDRLANDVEHAEVGVGGRRGDADPSCERGEIAGVSIGHHRNDLLARARPASEKGLVPSAESAITTAVASRVVRLSGGSVVWGSRV